MYTITITKDEAETYAHMLLIITTLPDGIFTTQGLEAIRSMAEKVSIATRKAD